MEDLNLYALKKECPSAVVEQAKKFSKEQAAAWPYGTYSPNDLTLMFEKGYLSGWLAGFHHVNIEREYVSIHGTDGCINCEHGRITIYAGSRYCVKCQHDANNGSI